jgi:triosephosphate isomerase
MSKKIANKIVVGNWKMNPLSLKEAEKLLINISKSVSSIKKTEIIICPPFIYLEKLKKISKKIYLGAQDTFGRDTGAYTGEISGDMLYNAGVRYVILGHSERRSILNGIGESNETINKKLKASIAAGLNPILCVGENIRDENHEYLSFIKIQLEECLDGISKNYISKIIIAYEPIWAIGKGSLPATPEEFLEMSIFIKKILSDKFGLKMIEDIKIIYGGSVDEKNTLDFIKNGASDGFLVGRASLNEKKFSNIVKICEALNK